MINVEKFRRHIIDLAIKGKLSERQADDGNAEDLISFIRREKEKIIEKGLLKREKACAPIEKDEIPFEIPENWTWVRLGDYSQKVTDQVASGSFKDLRENVVSLKEPDYALMVKTADFANNFKENLTYTNKRGYEFLSNSNLFGGELILSNIGSVGKVFIVPHLNMKMTLAPNSVMIRLVDDSLLMYLYYFFLSNQGFKELDDISTGTAVKKFNKGDLKTILVPIPPKKEQIRIIKKLDEIFEYLDKIASNQECLLNLQQILKSKVLELAIRGSLVQHNSEEGTADELIEDISEQIKVNSIGSKSRKSMADNLITIDEIPFDIPSNWKWCRLSEIGTTNIGLTYHPEDIAEQGVLVVRSSNIRDGKMDYKEKVYVNCPIADNEYLKTNDIIICSRNGSKALVGKNAIYYGESNKVCFGAFMAVFRTPLFEFVHLYFNTDAFKRYFSNDDSKQINQVTQAMLKESLIPIPPLGEQKRIIGKVNELMEALDKLL